MEDNNLKMTGYWISGIWLLFVLIYSINSEHTFWGLELNAFGDFLAGGIAPIAFLWFVLAFFQQSKELKQNTNILDLQREELKLTREEMAKQSEQLALQTQYMAIQVNREEFKDLPRLALEGVPSSTSGPNGYFMNISFKNVGSPIKELKIFSENEKLKEIIVSPIAYLDVKEIGTVRVGADSTNVFPVHARLEYKDVHGNEYFHEQAIENDTGSIGTWLDNSEAKSGRVQSLKKLNEQIRNE